MSEKEKNTEKEENKVENQKKAELLDEPIQVKDYLYLTLLSLESKAWAYMDLIAHPETQKHKKDMGEAKLAIDAMDALFKTIEQGLTPDQKKDIQTRLTNLRLNFVKK